MTRLIVRAALALTLIGGLLIGAIRLLARSELPAGVFFTATTDCTLPCWQGITPGETSVDEAIALLAANSWVEGMTRANASPSTVLINWTWSSDYPYGSRSAEPPPTLIGRSGVVWQIYLPTDLRFGDVWALLGAPDGGTVQTSGSPWAVTIGNIADYRDWSLWAETSVTGTCSTVDPAALWGWRTSFWLHVDNWALPPATEYPIYVTALRTGFYRVRAVYC